MQHQQGLQYIIWPVQAQQQRHLQHMRRLYHRRGFWLQHTDLRTCMLLRLQTVQQRGADLSTSQMLAISAVQGVAQKNAVTLQHLLQLLLPAALPP